ncbi:MAG: Omp28-related outer membrane protein [Bacteroidales bacterium]|jgi:hypothetical protein|nr:Omp28-related outer membrane protein [Bacteroidales bacterium]
MKILVKIALLGLFTDFLFQSCTKVAEPYYTIKSVYVDTNMRTAVLEDYTGHLCINCAPASRMAQELQELYKGQVFVISVHAGDFAEPDSTDPNYGRFLKDNFICQAGTDWFTYKPFNIDQNPKGMVNRLPYKTKTSILPGEWAGAIGASVALPKLAIISINNKYDLNTKTLTSAIGVRFLQNVTGKINLCVCLLEDSIFSGQLNAKPGDSIPIIKHFRFMDVLRGSLNGSWGEPIGTNVSTNFNLSKSFIYKFSDQPKMIPKHCSILAFILDADTKEIYHAAKMVILKPMETP